MTRRLPLVTIFIHDTGQLWYMWEGYIFPIKGIRKGTFPVKMIYIRRKGLDLGVEPSRREIFLTTTITLTAIERHPKQTKLANSRWQTEVGVCERHKNSRQTRWQTVGDK